MLILLYLLVDCCADGLMSLISHVGRIPEIGKQRKCDLRA
jgi:hypothetical protein